MLTMSSCRLVAGIAWLSVAHGALLWDGRFNDISSAADLDRWSWANQVSKTSCATFCTVSIRAQKLTFELCRQGRTSIIFMEMSRYNSI